MKQTRDYDIRYLKTDDVEQYNSLLRYAFQITEQELALSGWRGDEIKQSKFPILERADVLGCFDQDALVSQIAVYPLKMNVYNAVYHVGFVTSVCTYPEYSGKGLMKRLMQKSLELMRRSSVSRAAVSLFLAVSQNGVGNRFKQNHLFREGQSDSGEGVRAGLCAPRSLGK